MSVLFAGTGFVGGMSTVFTANWPLAIALAGLVLGAYVQGRFFGAAR